MTAKPSTAVATTDAIDSLEVKLLTEAKTPQERLDAYNLAADVRRSKMVRLVASELAETGWGKDISPVARAHVARYALEIGADPVRHLFVLAGSIYVNAQYYLELVAAQPDFVRDEVDFIHADPRADAGEQERRKGLRIRYGVDDKAPGAAVVTLYFKAKGPFIGVNWAGLRDKDPVGKAEPTKTAQTRAYRKAAIKAVPVWFQNHPLLKATEQILVQGREMEKRGGPELVPGQIETTEPEPMKEIGKPEAEMATVEGMTTHNPSARCPIDGPHPIAECPYEERKGA